MLRPESHQIDELAQRILKDKLPPQWVLREQRPDYGIDFHIEPSEKFGKEDVLTGTLCGVQLKGCKKPQISGSHIAFDLKTKHLKYYVDKCSLPVFLVVVDTEKSEGYWCFLQQYAKETLRQKQWRHRKTVRIQLPVANTLVDTPLLLRAIEHAKNFMASLRPASIEDAMLAKKEQLESLDRRLRVVIRAVDGVCTNELQAIEPVTFQITLKGPNAPEAAKSLFGQGRAIDCNPGLIEVAGSPLIEELFRQAGAIQFSRRLMASMRFATCDKDGRETSALENVPTIIEGGFEEFRLAAEVPNSPLSFSVTLKMGGLPRLVAGPSTFRIELGKWAGQRLQFLAYFDQLRAFVCQVNSGDEIHLECFLDGNKLFSAKGGTSDGHIFSAHAKFLEVFEKARAISRFLDIDPPYPLQIEATDLELVEELWWRLIDRSPRSASGWTLKTVSQAENLQFLLESGLPEENSGRLRLVSKEFVVGFLGHQIDFPKCGYDFTHFQLATSISKLRKKLKAVGKGSCCVEWKGAPQSEVTPFFPQDATSDPIGLNTVRSPLTSPSP